MQRLLSIVLICSFSLLSTGCGNVFVGGAINPGFSTVSGTVSFIQVTSVIDGNGSTIQVTFVTFFQSGSSSTVGFCGDQSTQFPMNQTVRADFNPGQNCSTIIVIVII